MDEREWLTSSDPMEVLCRIGDGEELSGRKARLFLVAVCRRIFDLLPDRRSRDAVEAAERFADGLACEAELAAAHAEAHARCMELVAWEPLTEAARVAECASSPVASDATFTASLDAKQARATAGGQGWDADLWYAEEQAHVDILRDIFGGPCRPRCTSTPPGSPGTDGTIPKLAEAAYQERALPAGSLDRDRLAVLADALEEVGADAALIEHLRGPGRTCVRGCHVVDLLTGRE